MPNPHNPPPQNPHAHLWIDLLLTSVDPSSGAPTGSDVVAALTRLARAVESNTTLLESIMGLVEDLQGEVATIKTSLSDALARVTAHETAEDATNAALQTQVDTLTTANAALQTEIDALKASGTETTALQAIMDDLKGVQTGIESIDPAPAPAPETPVP
jgi:phage shock protein A